MLVEKEVIRPGTYFYTDEKTGEPRKLVVTPEMCQRWHDDGNRMLSLGLTVPVPFEHDFTAHPMTPKDKLQNNSGWIKNYKLKDGALFSEVDIQDDEVAKKLPRTVRWTSPWISSFTDGNGRKWDNVISHLALTTRPRIIRQQPFQGIAAALSLAKPNTDGAATNEGYCLSRAGTLASDRPTYPLAFSLWTGVPLAAGDFPPKKHKNQGKDAAELRKPGAASTPSEQDAVAKPGETPPSLDEHEEPDDGDDLAGLTNPLADSGGDIKMEELLCDLLQALGVPMPDESNEQEFKRHLYEAAMSKIKELTSKGMGANEQNKQPPPDQNKPPNQNPHTAQPKNPLVPQVQQEQQPMYMSTGRAMPDAIMSLEDINKIEDSTMRTVALSMYQQNQALLARVEASESVSNAMRSAKLADETKKRQTRIAMLSRLSPKVKDHLDAMAAQQSMALSLAADGNVMDPMRATLDTLEAGLANLPAMLTVDRTSMTVVPHPTDGEALSAEGENALVESMARMMGGEQAPAA